MESDEIRDERVRLGKDLLRGTPVSYGPGVRRGRELPRLRENSGSFPPHTGGVGEGDTRLPDPHGRSLSPLLIGLSYYVFTLRPGPTSEDFPRNEVKLTHSLYLLGKIPEVC